MNEPEYRIFSLTKMTGQESKQHRTSIILGVEAPLRAMMVCLFGGVFGILIGAMFWPLLGGGVIFVPLLFAILAWWFFERRASKGLRLRTYRSMYDSQSSDLLGTSSGRVMGKFILCGQVISLRSEAPGLLSKTSIPVDRPSDTSTDSTPATAGEDWWTA